MFTCLLFYLPLQLPLLEQLFKRRDKFLDAFDIEPFGIVVAGVAIIIGELFAFVLPRVAEPRRLGRLDNVHLFQFNGVAGFVFRDQIFVQFLAGADADDVDLRVRPDEFLFALYQKIFFVDSCVDPGCVFYFRNFLLHC